MSAKKRLSRGAGHHRASFAGETRGVIRTSLSVIHSRLRERAEGMGPHYLTGLLPRRDDFVRRLSAFHPGSIRSSRRFHAACSLGSRSWLTSVIVVLGNASDARLSHVAAAKGATALATSRIATMPMVFDKQVSFPDRNYYMLLCNAERFSQCPRFCMISRRKPSASCARTVRFGVSTIASPPTVRMVPPAAFMALTAASTSRTLS
jgi:hypothetical protein